MDHSAACCATTATAASHPLDPLTSAEFQAVFAIIRASQPDVAGLLFETVELMEPTQAEPAATVPPRRARANIFRNDADGVWRLVVCLASASVLSSRFVPRSSR